MAYSEEMIYEIKNFSLGPQDKFTFSCKMCGNCCRRRDSPIVATGFDIFRIAKAQNISLDDCLSKYFDFQLGYDSHAPIVLLKERIDRSCVFLRKGRCTIQSDKPEVCALYPLGRAVNVVEKRVIYFRAGDSCLGAPEGHTWTLAEYISATGLDKHIPEVIAWSNLAAMVANFTKNLSSKKRNGKLIETCVMYMYRMYDLSKPYAPQADANRAELENILVHDFHFRAARH